MVIMLVFMHSSSDSVSCFVYTSSFHRNCVSKAQCHPPLKSPTAVATQAACSHLTYRFWSTHHSHQITCSHDFFFALDSLLRRHKKSNCWLFFMLGWPCIMNCMNNNQLDALFIFSLLSYHTSTCFGRINSPSSGGRMYIYIYIYGKWYLLYFWIGCQRTWVDSQLNSITSTIYHLFIHLPLDDGLLIRPKHVEVW
jgi:hypothetical protein